MSTSHEAGGCTKIGTVKATKLIVTLALGLAACSQPPSNKPVRYLIDKGTTGWVKVTYNRQEAPELAVQDGFVVVHLTAMDLNVNTRSLMNPSWDGSEFYYQSPDGKRERLSSADNNKRRLWAMEKTSDSGGDREVFFVGSEDQLNHKPGSGSEMGTGLLQTKRPDPRKMADERSDHMKIETELPK
jgi:hypothetical protein